VTEEPWGHEVVAGEYAGHPGLLYEPHPTSIVALLDHAARFGEATFLVQGERRISFDDFRGAVASVAAHLRARGVGPGERVLLVAHNGPAWVVALWASWLAGMTHMPWRSFLMYNALGGISWAVTVGLLAYLVGDAIATIIRDVGLAAFGLVAVAAVGAWVVHRRRARV